VARRTGKVFVTGNSGFPKSLDASRAIDKAAGAQRKIIGASPFASRKPHGTWTGEVYGEEPASGIGPSVTAPATEDAARWSGWGTALKPGQELWWLARKPIAGTVAGNLLEYGTGALNVDGCRVGAAAGDYDHGSNDLGKRDDESNWRFEARKVPPNDAGRWPPNLVLTHSAACELIGSRQVRGDARSSGQEHGERQGGFADVGADRGSKRPNGHLYGDQAVDVFACAPDCPVAELDRQSGALTSGANPARRGSGKIRDAYGEFAGQQDCAVYRGAESGGASRFYPVFRYQAKAPASERPRGEDGTAHPTVKSLSLMQWLVRLITPPGGTVLDMFAGSGPTAEACIIEGFRCVLIEKERPSAELIRTRLRKDIQPSMFGGAA
jgi:hypothetical protein